MEAYTSNDYFQFNNMKYMPNKHNIGFILNHRHDRYIIPPLNIMEGTLEPLSNPFTNKTLKEWI